MKIRQKLIGLWLFGLGFPYFAMAEPVNKSYFTDVAIGGYDSVYYHSEQAAQEYQPQQGDAYEFKWQGAVWKFATQESRDQFALDPTKFAPAYNGFCANALSLGEGLIKTDGRVWEIFDDKLYLFYAERGRKRWLSGDFKKYKAQSDKSWKTLIADSK